MPSIQKAEAAWFRDATSTSSGDGNEKCGQWKRSRIITHGWTGGGYKDSSPWKNVNRCRHSNDSQTNIGDKLSWAGSYIDGGWSDTHFYCFALNDSYAGTDNDAWRMQSSNESGQSMQNAMASDKTDLGVFMDYHHQGHHLYTMGGSNTTVDKVNMNNNSFGTASGAPNGAEYTSSCQGRLRGWTSIGGSDHFYTFANNTWSNYGSAPGTDGWGKANSSYLGHFYMKNGGNCTTSICKNNDYTGSNITTAGWVENSGEENYQQGNFKGWCCGHYNGAQNNNTYKMSYTSDTSTSTQNVSGHGGMSSAGCGSTPNFINSGYGYTPPSY